MKIPMPSPRNTNVEGKFINSYFLNPLRLALDAAPMYETSGTRGVKNGGMQGPQGAVDTDDLLARIEARDAITQEEMEHLRKMLAPGGEANPAIEEANDDDNWTSGRLGPQAQPEGYVSDEFEPMREALREKGFGEDDISRVLPRATSARPATEGGLGGQSTKKIGAMDSVLNAARNRLAWKRGDGLSISPRAEPRLPDEPNRLTAEQNRQLDDYLGIGRIKSDLCR